MGIRDHNLLESAVHGPLATFAGIFLHPDMFHMGAAYMYGIIQNHPFLDGNKRTGTISGLLFLGYNGYKLNKDVDLYTISITTAQGKNSIELLGEFFQNNTYAITE